MRYVRCIDNQGYEASLSIGAVYLAVPDAHAEQHGLIRIFDESTGEPGSDAGYLFAADRFQVLQPAELTAHATAALSVHLPPALHGILYAEALAANKSMSALVRSWIEERLDLPVAN